MLTSDGMRWAVVALLLCSMSFQAARGEIDAEQVRQAIDAGVNKLLDAQADDGTWTEVHTNMPGGVTALCTLALLTSGVSIDDPKIQRALTLLRKLHPHMTYTNSLQTLVMCAAEPKKDLLHIQENVRWLESQQLRDGPKRGAWGYGNKQGSGDNSNTQFALLALHEARRVGIQVNDQTWKLAQAYWLRTQNFDGSWGYMEGQPGTGSMTCAGITALLITMDELMRGDAEIVNGQIRCCGAQQDNDALERALDWMGRHFQASSNPGMGQNWLLYYLYGVERVGRLTNRRYLGAHDWYREGAEKLVAMQDHNIGWWRGGGHAEENREIATSLALLFLAKGRRPVLISKLQHQRGDDWNHHRADLGNLTAYVEKQWNRELTWQTIDLARATSDDLLQSPVLWMSGHESLQLNDNQVKALRDYIDRGGFLFAEQCCGNGDYDRSFRALMRQIYPEPEHELKLLPPEHPIWTAEERVDATYLKPLWGIDVGCRTAVVYCPEDLGCLWDIAHPGRDNWVAQRVRPQIEAARSIGINVLAYATNRELKYKLDMIAPPLAADQKDRNERAKVWLAKIRHSGGWNVAPAALPNLMQVVQREAGLRVRLDAENLALEDPALFEHHLLFIDGRHNFTFSDSERKQLRTFVERGGCVLADSVCSSAEFTAAFRREMSTIFKDHPLERIPAVHPMFTRKYGGFDLRQVTLRESQPAGAGGPARMVDRLGPPELEGVRIGDRFGVIFSPHDLSCALERHQSIECPGYHRTDAARIGLNVVMYSLFE